MGITFPNVLGQERVLRHAYKRANLDPNKTAYLECHGTGTPSGDPIEVRAVSAGMNDTRHPEKPLMLGAVKSNIGHSEAVSSDPISDEEIFHWVESHVGHYRHLVFSPL
jgi:acyl transferase domain-containing protein